MGADGPPLNIWAVSDGRAGIEAQALGLAEAVARLRPAAIITKRIAWRAGLARLPWRLIPPGALRADSMIGAPWPDIWIAAGRATLPLSTRMRRWSGGRTFVVQTQDPRTRLTPFDLVVPPEHDRLEGSNVLPIVGAPNRLTPQKLAADLARFADRIEPLPHPRVAVIVGGKSSAFDLPPEHAAKLASDIAQAVRTAGGALLVSFTRRTPAAVRAVMTQTFAGLPGIVWDGTGDNPYFAFLAAADAVLVTGESTNLAADAAATGRPVHVLPLPGRSDKIVRFHASLRARGIARPFNGDLGSWSYPPLRETDRAAAVLLSRYEARKNTT
jgi:mitochondrial fission protein ELM1